MEPKKPYRSAAAKLVARPEFGDGTWHLLADLIGFEAELLAMRQADKVFSDEVRIDTSPDEKLRRDELIPFLIFAEHEQLPADTAFRKPVQEAGIDLEYILVEGSIAKLQITTAYPNWTDPIDDTPSGGHQYRLFIDKLTQVGLLSGSGPFKRQDGKIVHNESCNRWEEIEDALRDGLKSAFTRKRDFRASNVTLLVRAVDYQIQLMHDAGRFRALIDAVAREAAPLGFERVIVVDRGEGFRVQV